MPVERGRPRSRAIVRSFAHLVVAASLGLTAAPLAAPSAEAAPLQTSSDSDSRGVTVVAAPADGGVVRQGTMLSMRVTVRNDSGAPLDAGEVVLSMDSGRVASAAQLAAWFTGDGAGDEAPSLEVVRAPVSDLAPGAVAVLDLSLGTAAVGFGDDAGPRRVIVDHVVHGTVQGSAATAIVWLAGDALPPAPSTVIVPLTTPGIADALLSAADLDRLTAPGGSLSRTLDAVDGHDVTLAIDPRILASIRVLGEDAPASARAFLDRLDADSSESFALEWADADPGLPLLATGTAVTAPSVVPGLTGSLPLDELTRWDHDVPSGAWPSAAAMNQEVVDALADNGAPFVLAPSALLEGTGGLIGTATRVVGVDSSLSVALADAASARSAQTAASSTARATALLAAAAVEGREIIGALDRDARSATRLEALLDSLAALPWQRPAPVAGILTRVVGSAGVSIADGADADLVSAASEALTAESLDAEFADIASEPETLIAQRRLELLAALSPGWGADRAIALDGFVGGSTRLRSSVQIIESSTITLLTDRTSLPITVENELPVAVTVYVRVAPATGELRVLDQRVELTLEPASRGQALVPVQSLTNGAVDITVSLRDGGGSPVGESTSLELNLQAGWETAGTVAIAALIAVLFAVGIVRDVRKRRRRRADSTPADDGEARAS